MVREAEDRGLHRWDASPLAPGAWDASAGARRAEAADVEHLRRRPALPDADAGKLAGLELDAQGQGEPRRLVLRIEQQVLQPEAAEPCRPGAALSAGRSCAALEVVEAQQPAAQVDAAQSL